MFFSLNKIRSYIPQLKTLKSEDLKLLLNNITTKVAELEGYKQLLADPLVIIAQVKTKVKHADADRLNIAQISIDSSKKNNIQIVCGAQNLKVGQYVAVAQVGALLPQNFKIKPVKIRGVKSHGMICSASELGLEESSTGIMDLAELYPDLDFAQYLGESMATVFPQLADTIFEIDNKSLTNRPDLVGHRGFAQEIAVLAQFVLGYKDCLFTDPKFNTLMTTKEELDIKIESKLCRRYQALKITGVDGAKIASPAINDFLRKTGHTHFSSIIDISNYVLTDIGQPMHIFDADKIVGKIRIRTAVANEECETLDGVKRKLQTSDLVIADSEKVLAIAGIIGCKSSAVSNNTKNIILEVANFDPITTRKSAQNLGIRTDSVMRFEKNLSPSLVVIAMHKAVQLIMQEFPQAHVSSALTDLYPQPLVAAWIEINTHKVNKFLGLKLEKAAMITILTALNYKIKNQGSNFSVKAPETRVSKEIKIMVDVIEDIGRIYGYEKITPQALNTRMILAPTNTLHIWERKFRLAWAKYGFLELNNYSFINQKLQTKTGLNMTNAIALNNSLSTDDTHLRTNLLPHILTNIAQNLRYQDHLHLFELGRVFQSKDHKIWNLDQKLPFEQRVLTAAVIVPPTKTKNPAWDNIFFKLKALTTNFINQDLHLKLKTTIPDEIPDYYHPGQMTALKIGKETIGQIGIIHPQILANFDIKATVAIVELNINQLVEILNQNKEMIYQQPPKFPATTRDFTLTMSDHIPAQKVLNYIKQTSNLITNIKIFDVFSNEEMKKQGQKSLSIRVLLRKVDATISGTEADQIWTKILTTLTHNKITLRS